MPTKCAEIFTAVNIENFCLNFFDKFLIFTQNIDLGYMFEPMFEYLEPYLSTNCSIFTNVKNQEHTIVCLSDCLIEFFLVFVM